MSLVNTTPSFSENIPNKIGHSIKVSGKRTLIPSEYRQRVAIADEPFDTKVDGKKMFCVRVDNTESSTYIMMGFTPMETFDSNSSAYFGFSLFLGVGINSNSGHLQYPVSNDHSIIDTEISQKAKEIVAILTVSENRRRKDLRFLCDGKESKSTDVSEYLKGDRCFAAICVSSPTRYVTAISIDQIQTRTTEIENLILEHQLQELSLIAPQQAFDYHRVLLQQHAIQIRTMIARMKFEMK
jgi:hypothetical protein